jgi:hypothetical protein
VECEQLSCCGIFELSNIGDVDYDNDEDENFEWHRVPARQAIAACKRDIREQLNGITPRGRMVIATTVAGMGTAVAALRALRFQPTRRFRNGNTGNFVVMWTKLVR